MSDAVLLAVLKAAQLIGATLLIGPLLFRDWVWGPALSAETAASRANAEKKLHNRVQVVTATGFGLLFGAGLADLLRIAATIGDPAAPLGVTLSLIAGTRLGLLLASRTIFGGLLWGCSLLSNVAPAVRKWLVACLSLSVAVGFSFAGHSAAGTGSIAWPALADMVHFLATAAWYGGLVSLAVLPWASLAEAERPSPVARIVDRFSNLGLLSMGLLALTGLILASQRLYGLAALVEEPYGQTLLVKLGFVAGVLALAAGNLLVVRPRLGHPSGSGRAAIRGLRWLVTGELVLGLVVICTAGVLSSTAPPQGAPVRLTVTIRDHSIDPPVLTIPRNKPIRLTVVNAGTQVHTWGVPELPHEMPGHNHGLMIGTTAYLEPGQEMTLVFTVRKSGEYEGYCLETGHRSAGETQQVIVK